MHKLFRNKHHELVYKSFDPNENTSDKQWFTTEDAWDAYLT